MHLIFLLGPFTLLPWSLVRLLFTLMAPLVVAASIWLWIQICNLNFDRTQIAIVSLLILTSWPAVWAYQQQQPTIYIATLMALAVFLFQGRSDVFAGILLSLATVKPNLVGLIVMWLLLQAAAQRRWRFLLSFGLSIAILLMASEAFVPGWISHWIHTAATYADDPSKVSLFIHLFGHKFGVEATVLMGIALCIRLWKLGSVFVDAPEFGQTVALLLAATVCIIPTTMWMIYNELLLIPGVLILIAPTSPKYPLARPVGWLAATVMFWTVLIMPLCAAMGVLVGYSPLLAILPFHNSLLPVAVVLSMQLWRNDRDTHTT